MNLDVNLKSCDKFDPNQSKSILTTKTKTTCISRNVNEMCTTLLVSRLNPYACIISLRWIVTVLKHFRSKLANKPPASLLYCLWEAVSQGKRELLLHSWEIKALYRAEKAILLSLLHSSSAASCHSLGAFLSMISIYRTREVLRRLREVSQRRVPEPSRTKSLSCHLRLHAVPTITHITASMNKRHQSGEGCWEHVYQAAV